MTTRVSGETVSPMHVLIAVDHTLCPRCGALPQDYQNHVIRGLQGSSGQVYVCQACWEEFVASCPSHIMPRSNSRAVA